MFRETIDASCDTTGSPTGCALEGVAAPLHVQQPESADPEFPGWIWTTMFLCYGIFLAALAIATGRSGAAVFAVVVSAGYGLIYFGTGYLLFGLKPAIRPSSFTRGAACLQTWTGPMSRAAVAGQVLTIPLCVAVFGVAIVLIRWLAV